MRRIEADLAQRLARLAGAQARRSELAALVAQTQPVDVARALLYLSEEEALIILGALDPARAAAVVRHLPYPEQYHLLHHMDEPTARQILSHMPSDRVVDLLAAIHPRQAELLLRLLPPPHQEKVRSLAAYPENTAGGRMTMDYISVREYMTVDEVLRHIRKVGREVESLHSIYVVNVAGRLVGVVTLRDLILAPPTERVSHIMDANVIAVPATMDQEEVAAIASRYDLLAVPVVDAEKRLLGIITADNIIDVLEEEATEDAYRMGATAVPRETSGLGLLQSVWALAAPRLPWLLSLLFLEMGSSLIVERFSDLVTPATAAMLAVFTVVMAGESGNAATQALAVVVRGLATGEIQDEDIMPRVILREALVGILLGVLVGGTLMLTGWLWKGSLVFGVAAGVALAVNLLIAKVLGSLFPVIIHRIGIDPAVASGPFITTLTDNTSVLIYYLVAAWILRTLG